MSKIPVGETIGQTYAFVFGRYLSLLGVVWLPMLVMLALTYFLILPFYQHMPDLMQDISRAPHGPVALPPAMMQMYRWSGLVDILTLAIFAAISVGIAKEVLGLRTGPRFVYVSYGLAEILLMVSYILLMVIFVVAIIALAIVGAIAGASIFAASGAFSQGHFNPAGMSGGAIGAFLLAAIVVMLALIYVFVRLSFLNLPVTVAERTIGIFRSWSLTRGNFWRIFVILLATLLPLIVLQWIAAVIMFGPVISDFIATAMKSPAAAPEQLNHLMDSFMRYLPYSSAIGFFFAPISYGLMVVPSALSYRALMPSTAAESEHR